MPLHKSDDLNNVPEGDKVSSRGQRPRKKRYLSPTLKGRIMQQLVRPFQGLTVL